MSTAAAQKLMSARPTVEALVESRFGWRQIAAGAGTIWFRGHVAGRSPEVIASEAATQTVDTVAAWLDGLDGHFSLIVDQPDWALAASDPVRSYPLIWTSADDSIVVTAEGPALERRLGLDPSDIDERMARAVALSGYTIGKATLYRGVRQIGPGEYLWVGEAGEQVCRYHQWNPWSPLDVQPDELIAPLSTLNRKVIDNLIASARGRTVLVPLSAGLDSRFIASGLKEAGYENVRCVAYGLEGNREAVTSREVARRLGYDWTFVPYTTSALRHTFQDPNYAGYKAYSDSLTGVHFPQEYRMLAEMRDRHDLATDTIVANGQAGDFIAGNHVPRALLEQSDTHGDRRERIADALVTKHYKLWSSLCTEPRLDEIEALLSNEIEAIGGVPEEAAGDHGIYEYCEFQDRQSKYVLNGQRVYEYFGLEWRLPLWDRAYMDFWAKAPLAAKKSEALYRRVLEQDNWGGVWRDIPTNPTRIRPSWMVPLRSAAKLLHAPLGKSRWHKFERRFFQYWMSATCAYSAWPWWTVARDQRGHANAISWHTADYLESKGLSWDGSLIQKRQ